MLIASACAALLSVLTAHAKSLPPAVVATGHNLLPLLISLIAWVWLGERLRGPTAIGPALGFAGNLVVIRPWEGAAIAFDVATIAALASGFAAALSKRLLYDIARNHNQSARATFIQTFGMATLISAPFAIHALAAGSVAPAHHAVPALAGGALARSGAGGLHRHGDRRRGRRAATPAGSCLFRSRSREFDRHPAAGWFTARLSKRRRVCSLSAVGTGRGGAVTSIERSTKSGAAD